MEKILGRKVTAPVLEIEVNDDTKVRCTLCVVAAASGTGQYKSREYNKANKATLVCETCDAKIC